MTSMNNSLECKQDCSHDNSIIIAHCDNVYMFSCYLSLTNIVLMIVSLIVTFFQTVWLSANHEFVPEVLKMRLLTILSNNINYLILGFKNTKKWYLENFDCIP